MFLKNENIGGNTDIWNPFHSQNANIAIVTLKKDTHVNMIVLSIPLLFVIFGFLVKDDDGVCIVVFVVVFVVVVVVVVVVDVVVDVDGCVGAVLFTCLTCF